MTSLLTRASREVPNASLLRRPTAGQGDPDLRWRGRGNRLERAVATVFFAIARPLAVWQQRIRDRNTLRCLPEYLLRDIGLDRAMIEAEADKPFWRA